MTIKPNQITWMEIALAITAGAFVWWLSGVLERQWAVVLVLLFGIICLRMAIIFVRWLLP